MHFNVPDFSLSDADAALTPRQEITGCLDDFPVMSKGFNIATFDAAILLLSVVSWTAM